MRDDDEADDEFVTTRRRQRGRKRRRLFIIGAVVAAVVLLPLGGIFFLFVLGALFRPNAKCPVCGREFSIPEEHRGTVAEWTRDYRCPNCGVASPAGTLYRRKNAAP